MNHSMGSPAGSTAWYQHLGGAGTSGIPTTSATEQPPGGGRQSNEAANLNSSNKPRQEIPEANDDLRAFMSGVLAGLAEDFVEELDNESTEVDSAGGFLNNRYYLDGQIGAGSQGVVLKAYMSSEWRAIQIRRGPARAESESEPSPRNQHPQQVYSTRTLCGCSR